jgi:hypothetical protein
LGSNIIIGHKNSARGIIGMKILNKPNKTKKMESSETILQGSSDVEKGAYLGAIASIASADRQATEEEVDYLMQLADAAGLSDEQRMR